MDTPQILVLGLGNILFQDEGLGVHAAKLLRTNHKLPLHTEIIDGGTLGLDLLTYFQPQCSILILDAIRAGKTPGELIRLAGKAIPATLAQKMSMHQLGLQDLLATCHLRDSMPQRVVLWGIEPAAIDWGLDCSPAVAQALPTLVACAAQEVQSWHEPMDD